MTKSEQYILVTIFAIIALPFILIFQRGILGDAIIGAVAGLISVLIVMLLRKI